MGALLRLHAWQHLERVRSREGADSGCAAARAGRKPSGLLRGHPAKLLRPSLHKASGLAFDGGKLNDIYQSIIECELAHAAALHAAHGVVHADCPSCFSWVYVSKSIISWWRMSFARACAVCRASEPRGLRHGKACKGAGVVGRADHHG